MWHGKAISTRKIIGNGLVGVAIDKEKGSQSAFKWALDNLLSRGQAVVLIHVLHKPTGGDVTSSNKVQIDKLTKDLFVSFRCYCSRKEVQSIDIVLEDQDVAKALSDYVSQAAIENLVLGSSSRGFMRKFKPDIPTHVAKGVPDFCNVYVVSKTKVGSIKHATRSAPFPSPLLSQIPTQKSIVNLNDESIDPHPKKHLSINMRERSFNKPRLSVEESFRSPFAQGGRGFNIKSFADVLESENDISFVSSGRPSSERSSHDISFVSSGRPSSERSSYGFDFSDSGPPSRMSTSSDASFGSSRGGNKFLDLSSHQDFSPFSPDSARSSSVSGSSMDDPEAEVKRLRLQLKQTMDLYSTACKEALTAKQKAMKAVEAAKKMADSEAQRRQALKDAEGMPKLFDAHSDLRYRRYSIDEIQRATKWFAESGKVGEGGYGPVYKCRLDHTPVAIKVLRPDAAQGRSQFQREIEVLSLIRHPHMVLLLGACPEYGILVYEYMAKGSLDECLFHKGKRPALSWQIRFRIAAEIASGLLFLHQTKPEPLVHRDLKPGNILLDNYYVSKISDVGLAKLLPAVAENVTQYQMTSTAGTFCYIDPEYQQTGLLGVKSDVYSLGIILLQLLTAKPPMGIAHTVEQAIEEDRFQEILDQDVHDWPMEEALQLAKLSLQCAELRRKDRPDLRKVVLPKLDELREFAEENLNQIAFAGNAVPPTHHRNISAQEIIHDRPEVNWMLSKSQSSVSSSQAEDQEALSRMFHLMKGETSVP